MILRVKSLKKKISMHKIIPLPKGWKMQ